MRKPSWLREQDADLRSDRFRTTYRCVCRGEAELPGVTPHTLRHTMGSTAVSTGEALALTGAILGHANPRSTAIYAHVQRDPSRRAADRVTKKIAAALAAKPKGKERRSDAD